MHSMNAAHYKQLNMQIKDLAKLCIVSKNQALDEILFYYDAGERIFAENRAHELIEKASALPKDIQWHFIGHLQKNKVRKVLPYLSCIQSLDSLELAKVIEKEAERIDKTISVYVELHLALDDTNKTGLPKEELFSFLEQIKDYKHLSVDGLMVMGPHTDDEMKIEEIFTEAHDIWLRSKEKYPNIQILSMGMSHDYPIALKCGSNLVRIGRYLFTE